MTFRPSFVKTSKHPVIFTGTPIRSANTLAAMAMELSEEERKLLAVLQAHGPMPDGAARGPLDWDEVTYVRARNGLVAKGILSVTVQGSEQVHLAGAGKGREQAA